MFALLTFYFFFFFNDTATTEIYTLSLHDALPISNTASVMEVPPLRISQVRSEWPVPVLNRQPRIGIGHVVKRSEEHTSELQSRLHLVCRLLLEKKKQQWKLNRKRCI